VSDVTRRFDARADDYARFRPGYPAAAVDAMCARAGLEPGDVVVDVGAGTGILTASLLDRGLTVYAVEPNAPMRLAAERSLEDRPGFHSVDARAAHTGLPGGCARLVVAAQAFHWFDREGVDAEFRRLLPGDGWLGLFWNRHVTGPGTFTAAYEDALVAHGQAYRRVTSSERIEAELAAFYRDPSLARTAWPNPVAYDWETAFGRARSSSYAPLPGAPGFEAFERALREAFDAHQRDGAITFDYETSLYLGRLGR
jgi:SAM-dependent methyltransferase